MSKGFVYIAENRAMGNLLKIGRTEKVPTARLAELFTTGVPEPFAVSYYALVDDAKNTELKTHKILSEHRHSRNREFFSVAIEEAIEAIRSIEIPEHEWKKPEPSHIEQVIESVEFIPVSETMIESRKSIPWEEQELSNFLNLLESKNLQPFVQSAFYDSNSNCCTIELAQGIDDFSEVAEEVLSVALVTISQFEWCGTIEHGAI